MRSFLTHRRALAIVIALLLLSCIAGNRWSTAAAAVPSRVVEFVATPVRMPLALLSGVLRGQPNRAPSLELSEPELNEQAALADVYIRQLEERLRVAEERLSLLTQSQEIALAGATNVEARVTGVAGDPTRPVLLIDKGTSRGIALDAPVVSGVYLVGLVKEASPATARVELVTAADAKLLVTIGPPRATGGPREVRDWATRSRDGPWFETKVAVNAPVQVGDWAQLADPLWPAEAQGFLVGEVTRIVEDPSDPLQYKRVIIEPIPLSRLRLVSVRVPAR